MNDEQRRFEVSTVGELRKSYYRQGELAPQNHLDPNCVPESLRSLIPLAEEWGISDDILRVDAVRRATPESIALLKTAVSEHEDPLDEWLAGPAANDPHPSQEYLAFTQMRMAADGC
jgi:hypothetical protein